MNIKKQKRVFKNEINPGSMADIGFLLLIFFLVSTTINTEKGISVQLPPINKEPISGTVAKRNLCSILVNKDDKLLVREEEMMPNQLAEFLKEFITNPQHKPNFPRSPKKAIISIQNDRATHYDVYIEVYNKIKRAYGELRDQQAQILYQKNYEACNKAQQIVIRQMIPMIISEADPTDLSL